MKVCAGVIVLLAFAAQPVIAQDCPRDSETGPSTPSEARTLEGRLIYHNGIRHWFELKLDKPQCGQTSIQLVGGGKYWSAIEDLRGCRVRSFGIIDDSPTGYYSLAVCQAVTTIEAAGACTRQPPLPPEPTAKPDKSVRSYRVDMHVDYSPGDHPVEFHITGAGKELHPWQAYASYLLTGGFVLYGMCGDGFIIDRVWGTPEALPSHFTESGDPSDRAMYDPESASSSGKTDLHLSYTCVRLKE